VIPLPAYPPEPHPVNANHAATTVNSAAWPTPAWTAWIAWLAGRLSGRARNTRASGLLPGSGACAFLAKSNKQSGSSDRRMTE